MYIDFMKVSIKMFIISSLVFFLSILSIFYFKLDYGLEFTGGLEIELGYFKQVDIVDVKKKLFMINGLQVKYYGSNKNLQLKIKTINNRNDILSTVEKLVNNEAKILRVDYIGPEMTNSIIKNSLYATFISVFCMIIYLVLRFNYLLAFSALISLLHDIVILLGIISFFKIEFNLAVFSALFAVFGYSINDTIVIFDRLRENINKNNKHASVYELINISINSTLSRTLSTSISTLCVTLIIFFFGGIYLLGFALVLSFGVIIGTYSSIYLSTCFMLLKRK